MAVIGSTSDLSAGIISPATTPKITNLSMATANTEYSHTLVDNLKILQVRLRNCSKAQISFSSGESSSKYFTILPGNMFEVHSLNFSSKTLYLQANSNGEVAEIFEYY